MNRKRKNVDASAKPTVGIISRGLKRVQYQGIPTVPPVASEKPSLISHDVSFVTRKPEVDLPLILDHDKALEKWQDSTKGNLHVVKDCRELTMRPDAENRPLWVCADGHVFCEAFSEEFPKAKEFLSIVGEPISRPAMFHEYQITIFTLYSAISLGLQADEIVHVLDALSKNVVDRKLKELIRFHGARIGKLKMVLRKGRYFLEAKKQDTSILGEVMSHKDIEGCLRRKEVTEKIQGVSEVNFDFLNRLQTAHGNASTKQQKNELQASFVTCDEQRKILQIEVHPEKITTVKATCHNLELPLMEEFDFITDVNPTFANLELNKEVELRPHQEKSLCQMFGNSRARSGIVVLPCGAGKTLVGVAAIVTMKKRSLILTSTAIAVEQWRAELIHFTNINPEDIFLLTSDHKETIPQEKPCVLISTYSMLGVSDQRRGEQSEKIMKQLRKLDWGLLIVDEVQLMPAKSFRSVATTIMSQCKLGLTATLVREDDLIADLQWLIGPKLYEAHWHDLQDQNFVARVQCVEIPCPMTKEFMEAYKSLQGPENAKPTKNEASGQQAFSHRTQDKLSACNPIKLQACEFLIRLHEKRGDKVIVFSDNVYMLRLFAEKMERYYISGEVNQHERMYILHCFKTNPRCNTIFLSKVGDNAIDLPCANVVIQFSSHFGSRRQEAQRLGRILRPKPRISGEYFNAFFYSLLSSGTRELKYGSRRQKFLVDQGYSYKVIPDIVQKMKDEDSMFQSLSLQKEILKRIKSEDQKPAK